MPARSPQNDKVQTPKGDASAYPKDVPKGKGPIENNKDWGTVNVDVQGADRNSFVESARVMPRRRSKAIEKSAPERNQPYEAEAEMSETEIVAILRMILGQR